MDRDATPLSRRQLIGLSLGAVAGAAAACGSGPDQSNSAPPAPAHTQPTSAPSPTGTSAPAPAAAQPSSHPPGTPAVEVVRGNGTRPEVALTFHGAGELSITKELLAILAQHKAHCTVLAVGTWLAANPAAARLILDEGHELGNHTWSHPDLAAYAPGAMFDEIARCRDELIKLTGSPGAFFRQSAAQHPTPEQLTQAGKAGYSRVLSYDVDSTDWQGASPAAIRKAVGAASAGSVVSLHFGRPNTVQALPDVLTDLRNRGLTAVTSTDLLR